MNESISKEELIEQAVLGRHKNGPWGYVAFPRHVPKAHTVPKGLLDPDLVQGSRGYDALKRCRERKKPIGWPVGPHSIVEMGKHFEAVLGSSSRIRLILSQADVYIGAFQHNIANTSMRLRLGAEAFLRLWEHVQAESCDSCKTCRKRVSTKDLKCLET